MITSIPSYVVFHFLPARREGPLPLDTVVKDYIRLSVDTNNRSSNTKYCLAQMLHEEMDGRVGRSLLAAANMRDIW